MPSPTMQTTRPSLTRPSARAAAAASVPARTMPSATSSGMLVICSTARWRSTHRPSYRTARASTSTSCAISRRTVTAMARTMRRSCRTRACSPRLTLSHSTRPVLTLASRRRRCRTASSRTISRNRTGIITTTTSSTTTRTSIGKRRSSTARRSAWARARMSW